MFPIYSTVLLCFGGFKDIDIERQMVIDYILCFKIYKIYYKLDLDNFNVLSKFTLISYSVQGYSRMSEVYYQTQNYDMAIEAFQKSFQNSASRQEKETFLDWSRKCKRELAKQKSLEARYPFVGAAIGIVIAVVAVAADFATYGTESTIGHPLLKVFVVVVVSFSCYIVASLIRNQIISSRKSILEPPPDLFGDRKIHKD